MTASEMRLFIHTTILSRFACKGARRTEALREVISVSAPHLDKDAVDKIADSVPELPTHLYEKWVNMFSERLLETVPHNQLSELCMNTPDSNATLVLLYSMFMESERMEKIVAEDLQTVVPGEAAPTSH